MPVTNTNPINERFDNIEYDEILESFSITEKEKYDYYYKIGTSTITEGWIFYIPVWDIHFELLLKNLIPFLLERNLPFIIPIDRNIHRAIQGGSFGYKNLGKIITILPNDKNSILEVAKHLIKLTDGFKGTPVPTSFQLKNIVYTRYGNYNTLISQEENSITDNQGFKIKDEEHIPAKMLNWVPWLFGDIANPSSLKETKILNNKYLITKIIKPDIKGKVMKALYQKNIIRFKTCIIKEGVKGVGVDNVGRDITDRLEWQFSLYKNLNTLISIPQIIDHFEDDHSKYLAFEFINGTTFGNYLIDIYKGRSWYDLQSNEKLIIINILIQIVENIQKIHLAGYIHRDLNAENIFIDVNSKIWLLDLELMYDSLNKTPYPPYERGTEGYISPEQAKLFTPKPEQDIYSIGSLLLISLMHVSPEKYNTEKSYSLKKQITFFNDTPEIVDLISNCLNHNELKRPKTDDIIQSLIQLKTKIKLLPSLSPNNNSLNYDELGEIIKKSINALSFPSMLNVQGYWSSPISTSDDFVGNLRLDRTVYTGFRKGISGILFTIGQAAISLLDTNSILGTLQTNLNLIFQIIELESNSIELGLYRGCYGYATALSSLMKAGLVPIEKKNLDLLSICLDKIPSNLNIADGLSGYGLTLLQCRDFLPKEYIDQRLNQCLEIIKKNQLKNGAWLLVSSENKPCILTGFAYGIAGIIYFLLAYAETFSNKESQLIAIKGLNYLLKNMKKKNNSFHWALSEGSKTLHEFNNGGYQILLPFIKAFKITKNIKFKEVVEIVLDSYPEHLVSNMLTLERGAAGIGEIYLDAWETFNNEKWYKRAEWISSTLINTAYNNEDYNYWLLNDPFHPHGDLLTGNCGILHFLLRINRPDLIKSIY